MKRVFLVIGLAAGLALASVNAAATVVTFESGVGGCGVMVNGDTFINQCAATGVVGSANDYYYVDARDTFDGQGISNRVTPGQLFFTTPVNNLSMDYVLLSGTTGSFTIYDVLHNVLGTFSDAAVGANVNASFSWGGSGIAEIDFQSGGTGVVGITTLRFDVGVVPAPATLALLGLGLAALGFSRRRKPN